MGNINTLLFTDADGGLSLINRQRRPLLSGNAVTNERNATKRGGAEQCFIRWFSEAKISILESGAIMASFPKKSISHDMITCMMGTTWINVAAPLTLPAKIFGHVIEIADGYHPAVPVLTNWVVLFRPPSA
ncbi:MAG: hypothetical protein KF734_21460 [Saprospiraceae bacterium]|nr:hypothetical protein [Saprospiraceae bacterium]